ncbi:MAG: hypothetical protein RMX65_002080 [Nostoc sp. DedQUE01]
MTTGFLVIERSLISQDRRCQRRAEPSPLQIVFGLTFSVAAILVTLNNPRRNHFLC